MPTRLGFGVLERRQQRNRKKRMQDLEVTKEKPITKRKPQEIAMASAKKKRIARFEELVKDRAFKKQRRPLN